MLPSILSFKNNFLTGHRSRIHDIVSFENELRSFHATHVFGGTRDTFWSNYMHAALISSYQEVVGYSLDRWNEYQSIQATISALLNIRSISSEGTVLEHFVLHSINQVFDFGPNPLRIRAYVANNSRNPTYLTDDSNAPGALTAAENARIIGNIKTVMKIRGQEKKEIWGDNDIIVLLEHGGVKQQFCIISCKTSLRERVYQSVFWSLHSRLQGVGKHVFVTADKGASGRSEIGNRTAGNVAHKSRDVLESTMDRVYVLRDAAQVNRSQVIKDFDYLQEDLIAWSKEHIGL